MGETYQQIISDLINSYRRRSASETDIVRFLHGLKLGLIIGGGFSRTRSLECAKVVFEFQKQLDPDGLTWEKGREIDAPK